MRSPIYLFLAIFLFAGCTTAAEPEVIVVRYPDRLPERMGLAESIIFTIKNTGDSAIVLPPGTTLRFPVNAKRIDGSGIEFCSRLGIPSSRVGEEGLVLQPGESIVRETGFACYGNPGTWSVSVGVEAEIPSEPNSRKPATILWRGEAESTPVFIEIYEVSGRDKEALDLAEGHLTIASLKSLSDAPNSVYFPFHLWRKGNATYYHKDLSQIEPNLAHDIKVAQEFRELGDPAQLKGNEQRIYDKTLDRIFGSLEYWDELVVRFPDFVYRPDLMLRIASVYLQAGDSVRAGEMLRQLKKEFPISFAATRAEEYIDYLETNSKLKGKAPTSKEDGP